MTQEAALQPALLVFTDLDGSLMEHETYSIEPAMPALQEVLGRGFALIMNSSKTAAEILALQKTLKLSAPFVCENGAALQLLSPAPDGQSRIVFGQLRSEWLPAVHAMRAEAGFEFEGFADWQPDKISELTGLDKADAELAQTREYSEPILWRGSAKQKELFESKLAQLGLNLLEGGRFHSIQGQHTKSDAMHWLKQQQSDASMIITVALGDSPNDSAMLDAADIAVIIKSGKSARIELHAAPQIIRTSRPGPAGWQDAMSQILAQLDSNELAIN